MKDGKAWVGDVVFDEDEGRTGIVHDVKDGVYLLRTEYGGDIWTTQHVDRLTVTTPREERVDQ